jgi:hypothetical protein
MAFLVQFAPTGETGMALGLVLIAMTGAAAMSVGLFIYQFPFWIVLLAYPVTGAVILLPGVLLFAWIRQNPPDGRAGALVTSPSPATQHPQSPAGSSNP